MKQSKIERRKRAAERFHIMPNEGSYSVSRKAYLARKLQEAHAHNLVDSREMAIAGDDQGRLETLAARFVR